MATKAEVEILKALAGLGYWPKLAAWVGSEKGWEIQYAYEDGPGKLIERMNAKNLNHALSQIAWLGRNSAA